MWGNEKVFAWVVWLLFNNDRVGVKVGVGVEKLIYEVMKMTWKLRK